jgi:hypothetical protein
VKILETPRERNLIRSTRQEYTANVDLRHHKLRLYYMQEFYLKVELSLMILILLQVVLEPDILVGASVKYRQDELLYTYVWFLLQMEKILKSVYISKQFSSH